MSKKDFNLIDKAIELLFCCLQTRVNKMEKLKMYKPQVLKVATVDGLLIIDFAGPPELKGRSYQIVSDNPDYLSWVLEQDISCEDAETIKNWVAARNASVGKDTTYDVEPV